MKYYTNCYVTKFVHIVMYRTQNLGKHLSVEKKVRQEFAVQTVKTKTDGDREMKNLERI